MLRGTLRMPGYCKAWNVFVKLGLTDDTYKIKNANTLTYTDLLESFLPKGNIDTLKSFTKNCFPFSKGHKSLKIFTINMPIVFIMMAC